MVYLISGKERKRLRLGSDHQPTANISDGENTKKKISKSLYNFLGFLVIGLLYVSIGAWIFVGLEDEDERRRTLGFKESVQQARNVFLNHVLQITENCTTEYLDPTCTSLFQTFSVILQEYEFTLNNVTGGDLGPYLNSTENLKPRWTYFHSLLFVFTLVSTIGYGNLTPHTINGRIFCIIYAIFGIPIALIQIHLSGKVLAALFINAFEKSVGWKDRNAAKSTRLDKFVGTTLSVIFVLMTLLLYNTLGAFLYDYTEGWGFVNSFYFCFTTLTTVGFGDFVPRSGVASGSPFASIRFLYVLFGLSLTSSLFELVRNQYCNTWSKKEIIPTKAASLFVAVQKLEKQNPQLNNYFQKTTFRMERSTELLSLA